jgi:long-chain acyl-CoA synthetase
LALGIPVIEGYGLTEAAPVVAANRVDDNLPGSVGRSLPGVEVRLAADGELLVRAPSVMVGYWNQPAVTHQMLTDGWLHTGDKAELREGRVYIVGRIKEILCLSSGEKVHPATVERSITTDPLFEQALVVGEGMPYVVALLVLNPAAWNEFASERGVDPEDPDTLHSPPVQEAILARLARLLSDLPSPSRIRAVHLKLEPFTVAEGHLTPTLKLRRAVIEEYFAAQIQALYAGRDVPR